MLYRQPLHTEMWYIYIYLEELVVYTGCSETYEV